VAWNVVVVKEEGGRREFQREREGVSFSLLFKSSLFVPFIN
jgi:hypothetical protein